MKKTGLRALGVLVAFVMAIVLCACGSVDPSEGVTFQNDLDVRIQGIFISSTEDDTWGEHVNDSALDAGKSVVLEASVLPSVTDDTYDVGLLDDENMVYEFYRVPVVVGDKLTVFVGDDGPTLVVTDQYGNDTAIDGYMYSYE